MNRKITQKKGANIFPLGVRLNVLANQNALFFECGPDLREIGNLSEQQCMMQQFLPIVFPQFCGNNADFRRRVLRTRAAQWFVQEVYNLQRVVCWQ